MKIYKKGTSATAAAAVLPLPVHLLAMTSADSTTPISPVVLVLT